MSKIAWAQVYNAAVKLDVHDQHRQRRFRVELDAADPPAVIGDPASGEQVALQWDQAFDESGLLRRCPVCGCRELFVRKDFPQNVGLWLVIAAAIAAMVLFAFRLILASLAGLVGVALLDALIWMFTGRCLVCYRCRSEMRDLPIAADQPAWDLATGEKYRVEFAEDPGASGEEGT